MVTFEQARDIVDASERPTWLPEYGTFMVADYGWEDATSWKILSGPREYLVGNDFNFLPVGSPVKLVDKDTGEITEVWMTQEGVWERLDAMTPVGDVPRAAVEDEDSGPAKTPTTVS
jgi:hypothetical protein